MLPLLLIVVVRAHPGDSPPGPETTSPAASRSVYQLNPPADAAIIALGSLGVILPYAFENQLIRRRCPCDPSEVNALDRHVIGNANSFLDSVSDVSALAAMLVPLALDSFDLGLSRPLFEDAVILAEVLAVNGALVALAKFSVQRPLPRVYAEPDSALAQSPGGFRSFYSGHTSTTVASLSAAAFTLKLRYSQQVWPWLAVGLFGAAVGAERVAAGRHFYTDVVVGALAGAAVGTAIPWLHARARTFPEGGGSLLLVPARNGMSLAWLGRF
jgi:membrane-associated phospholipid phosphatase